MQAIDIDLPPNSDIGFYIIDGDPDGHFDIDEFTGEISVLEELDYEAMEPEDIGKMELTVMAMDGGEPPLNTTVPVVINVQVR